MMMAMTIMIKDLSSIATIAGHRCHRDTDRGINDEADDNFTIRINILILIVVRSILATHDAGDN